MDAVTRFETLYDATSSRVLAYCLRHVGANDAADLVAETFTVAWRRIDELPAEPLPWLLGTARRIALAHHRRGGRRQRLPDLIQRLELAAAPSFEESSTRRLDLISALARLSDDQREAILLTCWDDLTTADAAAVAGCTPGSMRVRTHRARARLRTILTDSEALS